MIQTQIINYDLPKQEGNRKQQAHRILKLLKEKRFVTTSLLRTIACQYNARIYELRHGKFDGVKHQIKSETIEVQSYKIPGFIYQN